VIGTRTPFRISFVGGGTDLREFYSRHPGCVVSTTINKYMYIFVHRFFEKKIQVKYSRTELVRDVNEIRHPIVREALKKLGLNRLDINSIADIPAGTGLGSSSSFAVGLLHALYAYMSKYQSKEKLAQGACSIEIDMLEEPIGKQDQYAAAYGGLNFITFCPNEDVNVEPIIMHRDKLLELENNLLLFYTGKTRDANDILSDQRSNIINDKEKFSGLIRMTELAKHLRRSLVKGNLDDFGLILDENWQLKKSLSDKISQSRIDKLYEIALKNGAKGGKLLGAGGGGFLAFYCEMKRQESVRRALADLEELTFSFDSFGSRVIYVGDE